MLFTLQAETELEMDIPMVSFTVILLYKMFVKVQQRQFVDKEK